MGDEEGGMSTGVLPSAPQGFYKEEKEKKPREPLSTNTKLAIGSILGLVIVVALIAVFWPRTEPPFVCRTVDVPADVVFVVDGTRGQTLLESQHETIKSFVDHFTVNGDKSARFAKFELSTQTESEEISLSDTTTAAAFKASLDNFVVKSGRRDHSSGIQFALDQFNNEARESTKLKILFFMAGESATAPVCYNETQYDDLVGPSPNQCLGPGNPAGCVFAAEGVFFNGANGCTNNFFPSITKDASADAMALLKSAHPDVRVYYFAFDSLAVSGTPLDEFGEPTESPFDDDLDLFVANTTVTSLHEFALDKLEADCEISE